MKRMTWLLAACAVAGFGCSGDEGTQVITGRVARDGAVAVRAIAGDSIVTAARVRSDGSFTLRLPAGARYRLEVLSASGVRNVVGAEQAGLTDLVFSVCAPTDPFDLGGLVPGDPGSCDPSADPNTEPGCVPPMPCDLMSDPSCEPPPCLPGDPNCWPLPCDPMSDPSCGEPPPCDPMTDPTCEPPPPCDPGDPNCTKCDPMSDPGCEPPCGGVILADGTCAPCDPTVDANCPIPPPPCSDPMDPNTCKDPCIEDPALCGCAIDGTVNDVTCWPPPEPCELANEMCAPGDALTPEHFPGDFGCKEPNG